MRSYKVASRLPLIRFGEIQIPQLMLGYLPFVGESYQGPVKNAEYLRRFSDIRNTVAILTKAVKDYGTTVMGAPTPLDGAAARMFLKAIEETSENLKIDVALIVCLRIPLRISGNKIDDYRRWLTYYEVERNYGGEDLLSRYLGDPVLQARENWESRFLDSQRNSASYFRELGKLEIDYDLVNRALFELEDLNVLFIDLGSETDLLAMGKRTDLLADLVDWISDNYGYRCLLSSHHAGSALPILESSEVNFYGYLTPVNKLGVMMFPTQRLSEDAVRNSKRPIIAIKPFAGGRLHPQTALEYVYNELGISSCMIGVGSSRELEQDLSMALQVLST